MHRRRHRYASFKTTKSSNQSSYRRANKFRCRNRRAAFSEYEHVLEDEVVTRLFKCWRDKHIERQIDRIQLWRTSMKRFSQRKKVGYPSAMLWALDLLYIVLQDLNPVTQHRCEHLITELVHRRDATRTLIWQRSYDTNSFTWLYQTRLIVWLSRLPAHLSQISPHH